MAQHDHDHEHDPHVDTEEHELTYYEKRIIALSNLLIDKGLISSQDLLNVLKEMEDTTPMVGAKVVARAWADADFKQRLLQDANLVMGEMGIVLQRFRLLKVVENTDAVHNAVVCTLCSCYPIPLLGYPPDWYKDETYRSWIVDDPRACLSDMGMNVPDATRTSAYGTPLPKFATWCCHNAPWAPRAWPRRSSPNWSPATA